jgi:uncharacterized membrane protein
VSTSTQVETATPEAPPRSGRRLRWSPTRHTYGVAAVMVFTAAAYLTVLVQNWRRLSYSAFDSVIFDQAIRNYSNFRLPHVPVKSTYAGLGPGFIQLGDHFSPIHALLAPLYWVWDDIRVLFVAQAVFYAIAAALVWRFTWRILGVAPAYLVAIAFGLSWGLQSAMLVGYHELDCAVLLLALVLERLYAGRHRQALIGATLLLLVKEEMGLVVAVLGVLFFIRGHRRWGAALSGVGLVWSALAIKVFVPAFSGSSQQYWTYRSFGPGPLSAAKFALTHPGKVVNHVVATDSRQQLLLWLLVVALGAYLVSPITLLALPSLTLRLLSDTPSYSQVYWQYNAPLMVILLMAGVDGIARLAGWLGRWSERSRPDRAEAPSAALRAGLARTLVWAWVVGILAVAGYGCTRPQFAFSRVADQRQWQQTAYQRAAFAIVGQIPRNAKVEADPLLAPLISSRTPDLVMVEGKPHGSEYVALLAKPGNHWPYRSRQDVFTLKQYYLDHGYAEIWSQDDVFLLRRQS